MDRNRRERHANEIGAGIGSGNGNIPRAGTRCRLRRHHGGTGIGCRARNHEDGTARVFIDRSRKAHDVVDQVACLDDLGGMVDIADHFVQLVVQLAYLDIARILGAISAIKADLRGEHGQRLVGADAAILNNAGLRVEARGNIGRNNKRGELVYRRDPNAEGRARRTMEACAQNGVDDHIGLLAELHQLVARRADNHVDVTACRAAGDVTRKSARNLARINRRDDIDMDALLLQNVRSDPAIAPVVAKTGQHEHAVGMLRLGGRSKKLSRMLHELCFRSPFTLDDIFESSDFLDIQNRLHLALSILKSLIAALDALKLVKHRARLSKRLRDALFFILCGLFCTGSRLFGQSHSVGDRKVTRCRKRQRKLNDAALLCQFFCPSCQKNGGAAILPSRNRDVFTAHALKARAQRFEHRLASSKAASVLRHGTRGGFAKANFLGREDSREKPGRNLTDTLHARNLNNIDANAGFCHHDPLWQSNRTVCLLYPHKRNCGVDIQE